MFRPADTHAGLAILGDEAVEVDLALDARPEHPPMVTSMGTSLAPLERAAHTMLALFDPASRGSQVTESCAAARGVAPALS